MTPWQTAIDALRSRDLGESDDEYEAPTEATRQRALAWMEARSFTDPIRWPTRVDTLPNGGLRIEFRDGANVKLQVEFENDDCAEWIEWRDGEIVARGKIPTNAVGEAARTPPVGQQTAGGF